MRRNPVLPKAKGFNLKNADRAAYDAENIMRVGPLGNIAKAFGMLPSTYVVYFLIDPTSVSDVRDVLSGRNPKGKFPMFQQYRAGIAGPGTIDLFWKNPLTKKFAGAAQYFTTPSRLVITHIAVKPGWQKHGVASTLIESIVDAAGEGRAVYAHEVTREGRAAFQSFTRWTGTPVTEIKGHIFDFED